MLISLCMIARSDPAGLERAVSSVRDHVDEVVIGVDDRSDTATHITAVALADQVYLFHARDLGLTTEEWAADKMHFANARNIGRERAKGEWILTLDTDEYLTDYEDLRAAVRRAQAAGQTALSVDLDVGEGHVQNCAQRLTPRSYQWDGATHNQLITPGPVGKLAGLIIHRTDLRSHEERERREAQRNAGVADLAPEAAKGEIASLFHLAKHRLAQEDEAGVTLTEDFRLRMPVRGDHREERTFLAVGCALFYYRRRDFARAELWATRALLDGPDMEAFCMLGVLCEQAEDFLTALAWYECACVLPDAGAFKMQDVRKIRFERRDYLRANLRRPS